SKPRRNHHQRHVKERRHLSRLRSIKAQQHPMQIRRPRKPIQITEPEQQKRRRHSSEQVILDGSLGAFARLLRKRRQDVQAQAQQLKPHKNDQQILRRRNQQPARSRHQHHGNILAHMLREIRPHQQKQRQYGQYQNPDLRNRRVSAGAQHHIHTARIRQSAERLQRHRQQRRAASNHAPQHRRHHAHLQRRLAQKSKVDEQHQQRSNFQSRLRQHHAKEI